MKRKRDSRAFYRHGATLTFQFDTAEAASHFKRWLCGSGEQQYWDWMERREEEEDGEITGLEFNYWTGNERIPVRCGRLKREE